MGKAGYGVASDNLEQLKALQRRVSNDDLPSENVVNMEIAYNKMEIVKYSYRSYGAFGAILLILFLISILMKGGNAPRWVRILERISFWMVVLTSIYLATGLTIRALISGHVPWSDGYEALLYISLVTVVVGLLLYRLNKVILAAACLLAFFLLFVSSLNILDPEITSLQPVLKSYWLKIHVAIITASYAPLGIGAVLGLINLVLYIARNESNGTRLGLTIKQLTYITEIVITVGVIMLTIGTFLGGIWANESWGRYWGWDPKETWALVAILAYAVILHLRFIPGVKDHFTFNAVSLWGYSTILFTFFGVNFYLVGLHS
jgi:cytochrome c-type biogenesis protein CcsB